MDDLFLSQLNCSNDEEVDLLRPLPFGTLENTIQSLRIVWSQDIIDYPLPRSAYLVSHPLAQALFYTLDRRRVRPPLDCSDSPLPLNELCQLCLLWSILGYEEAGYQLALKILPLCSFPSLWCAENQFNEDEVRFLAALIQRGFGIEVAPHNVSDPYLQKLSKYVPSWQRRDAAPYCTRLSKSNGIQSVEVLTGKRVSLGAIRSGEIEVRAIGPQMGSFNDLAKFGITRSENMGQWAYLAADPTVWMRIRGKENSFSFSFVGISNKNSFSICLYVVADLTKIGEDQFQSKSLRRYRGKTQEITFKKGESSLSFSCSTFGKMELIPLAGEGCFWNAKFLLAFEVSSSDEELELHFS